MDIDAGAAAGLGLATTAECAGGESADAEETLPRVVPPPNPQPRKSPPLAKALPVPYEKKMTVTAAV